MAYARQSLEGDSLQGSLLVDRFLMYSWRSFYQLCSFGLCPLELLKW